MDLCDVKKNMRKNSFEHFDRIKYERKKTE